MQNQTLDLKTFRDRFLSIWELFWSPFWPLKSRKNQLKIKRILETICEAILIDLGEEVGRLGVALAECAGLLEA